MSSLIIKMGLVFILFITVGYTQNPEDTLTIEQRLTALERQLAGLETRFDARTQFDAGALPGAPGPETSMRIQQLERRLDSLETDLRRVATQADTALREANQARREAMAAERSARDALNRAR